MMARWTWTLHSYRRSVGQVQLESQAEAAPLARPHGRDRDTVTVCTSNGRPSSSLETFNTAIGSLSVRWVRVTVRPATAALGWCPCVVVRFNSSLQTQAEASKVHFSSESHAGSRKIEPSSQPTQANSASRSQFPADSLVTEVISGCRARHRGCVDSNDSGSIGKRGCGTSEADE
jgi:hypothetical protein